MNDIIYLYVLGMAGVDAIQSRPDYMTNHDLPLVYVFLDGADVLSDAMVGLEHMEAYCASRAYQRRMRME